MSLDDVNTATTMAEWFNPYHSEPSITVKHSYMEETPAKNFTLIGAL